MQKSKDTLKACFENVNIRMCVIKGLHTISLFLHLSKYFWVAVNFEDRISCDKTHFTINKDLHYCNIKKVMYSLIDSARFIVTFLVCIEHISISFMDKSGQ